MQPRSRSDSVDLDGIAQRDDRPGLNSHQGGHPGRAGGFHQGVRRLPAGRLQGANGRVGGTIPANQGRIQWDNRYIRSGASPGGCGGQPRQPGSKDRS